MSATFCPRCGDRLVERNGVLQCIRGRMVLTAPLTAALKAFAGPATAAPIACEGPRYCPRCATALVALACPRGCGSLADLAAELERQSHWVAC